MGEYFSESKNSARGIYEVAHTVTSDGQNHWMHACSRRAMRCSDVPYCTGVYGKQHSLFERTERRISHSANIIGGNNSTTKGDVRDDRGKR